jgi:LppP/LprE lipoprotein
MRLRVLMTVLAVIGLVVAGCGWKPPGSPPAAPDTCTASDGPASATVSTAIASLPLPPGGASWRQVGSGHATNCRLYWVQVSGGSAVDALQHVLFFDHNTYVGTATPNPRPYTTVVRSNVDTVTVQYQWQQANDEPNRPTGIGVVRYRLGSDGKIQALDPLPG